jgi:hypothetical protein
VVLPLPQTAQQAPSLLELLHASPTLPLLLLLLMMMMPQHHCCQQKILTR